MKKMIIFIIVVVVLGGVYYAGNKKSDVVVPTTEVETTDVEVVAVPETTVGTEQIIGTWQSIDDEQALVIFNEDGSVENMYGGQEVSGGTWSTSDEAEGAFLHTVVDGEKYEYVVLKVNETTLTLSYLAHGNTLNYTRVENVAPVNSQ